MESVLFHWGNERVSVRSLFSEHGYRTDSATERRVAVRDAYAQMKIHFT